jgi:hypothetical protein
LGYIGEQHYRPLEKKERKKYTKLFYSTSMPANQILALMKRLFRPKPNIPQTIL